MKVDYGLPLPRGVMRFGALLLVAILVLPALVVVPVSFSSGSIIAFPLPGLSLHWYGEALASGAWRDALGNSLRVGIASALIATLIGTAAALGIDRLRGRARVLALLAILLPLVVPIVILALGAYFALATVSLSNSLTGLVIFHSALGLPFVTLSVVASLQSFDRTLWRAAASLGAGPLTAFRRVMLPIIAPGVAAGAVFAFATSLDEVVIASFVTAPSQRTLPLQMFSGIKENTGPIVTAVATLLLLLSITFLVAVEALRRRSRRLASTGQGA
ncbi:ABC transporter permease [Kaistia sp. 32K]|uniref:ABC transporter permease n=1 Tax=Kaistia sp. 32K TaxID=2795690 RepID=UPI0019387BB0|nr:ABC transporter permease [Kaistia sp. 32K]BCP54842.1 ABC transporter permease [Kaistia sp. 32K]